MIHKKIKIISTQLIVGLWFLALSMSLSQAADVTLAVGAGSGSPGSTENPVVVSLDNQNNEITGIQVDICDVDDYLTCTGCETTERASSFDCLINELVDGCCRVVLLPLGGGLIEEGTGSIFTLKYDSSSSAPEGECRDLNPENISVVDVYHAALDVLPEPGLFCFSGSVPTSTTTSIPPISTTTTTITSSCQVSISPLSSTLISGTSMQFSARTECDGEEVEGIYGWQIVPDSTIGSAIDGDGLFTAGDNTTDSDVDETVRVTDTAHGNKSVTANVTIKVKQTPVGCEVEISPLAATVSPGDTVTLIANSIGDCDTPLYAWVLTTETDSLYEPQGGACDYTAGANDGTEPLTDVITVSDTVNGVGAEATITIQAEGVGIEVSPENLWRSHLLPLPYLIVIRGEGTHFKAFGTNLSFDPPEAVFPFWPIVLGNSSIWDIILVMPSWLAGVEDQTVTVTVTTGDEVVSDEFTLKLLPFILDQNRSLQ